MYAEIADFKDNELELKIREEDISILYIIQHELLKEKSVDFAGVMLKHPLVKDYIMRVVTKRKDPVETVQEAAASAAEYAKDFASLVKSEIK
jgi:DNA-directed RNA polymerase subunit L